MLNISNLTYFFTISLLLRSIYFNRNRRFMFCGDGACEHGRGEGIEWRALKLDVCAVLAAIDLPTGWHRARRPSTKNAEPFVKRPKCLGVERKSFGGTFS